MRIRRIVLVVGVWAAVAVVSLLLSGRHTSPLSVAAGSALPAAAGVPAAGEAPSPAPSGYLMAYNGCTLSCPAYSIGIALSEDGLSFHKDADDPVLRPGPDAWDALDVKDPDLLQVGSGYLMYYSGFSGTSIQIGLATSLDGFHWTKYAENPVLPLPGNVWHRFPKVVYDPAATDPAQMFKLWYIDDDGDLAYAYSSDGLRFTSYAGNPVLSKGNPGEWDGVAISSPGGIYHAAGGTWYLFYNGRRNASGGISGDAVGLATFSDPESTYTRVGNNPLVAPLGNATAALRSDIAAGSKTVVVVDTSAFRASETIFLYEDGAPEQMDRIASIDSATQMTLSDHAARTYAVEQQGLIRSAYFGSLNSSSFAIHNGTYYLYGTAFQPLGDKGLLDEYAVVFSSRSLTHGWSIDLDAGILLGYPAPAPEGGWPWDYASAENSSVIPLFYP